MPAPTSRSIYRGRFAPSPTGALHIGSLLAAVASYLDARAQSGIWLVRIDDIDPPREIPGASDAILRTLDIHGLHWDESILYQSSRLTAYQEALQQLIQQKVAYPCSCSRKQSRTELNLYSGHCRDRSFPADDCDTIRINLGESVISFQDRIQGNCEFLPGRDLDDFVIRRRDGFFSYQLAAAIDDLFQKVTHVVRGADLLTSSARQAYLINLLGHRSPIYAHIPVLINEHQQKLSKQNLAPPLDDGRSIENLLYCLSKLGQPTPPEAESQLATELLQWAAKNWHPDRIPANLAITL